MDEIVETSEQRQSLLCSAELALFSVRSLSDFDRLPGERLIN